MKSVFVCFRMDRYNIYKTISTNIYIYIHTYNKRCGGGAVITERVSAYLKTYKPHALKVAAVCVKRQQCVYLCVCVCVCIYVFVCL